MCAHLLQLLEVTLLVSTTIFLCIIEQGCGHAVVVCREQAQLKAKLSYRWLQFWRMLLLTSGDVETNPGPTRMTPDQINKVTNGQLGK